MHKSKQHGEPVAALNHGVLRRKPLVRAVGLALLAGSSALAGDVDLSMLGDGGFAVETISRETGFGSTVSGAGDVNGDGLADLIIGAHFARPGGIVDAGRSYVLFGKAVTSTVNVSNLNADEDEGFIIVGAAEYDRSGISVSGAGDVNGDGLGDLIVGATGVDPGGNNRAGSSYVVFGKAGTATVSLASLGVEDDAGFAIEGAAAGDRFGNSVSGAGDVNGRRACRSGRRCPIRRPRRKRLCGHQLCGVW